MAGRADSDTISNRRHVRRAMQAVGLVALLSLAVGAVLTATGALAGGLAASSISSVKLAYAARAPILTDTAGTSTSTSDPCDPVWSVVSSPNPGTPYSVLNGVAVVTANDVWAVGFYYNDCSGCPAGTLVEHWDGASWSVVPSPDANPGNFLYGVAAVSANDVWAVGGYNGNQTLIEHWNGTSWSLVPSPDPGTGQPYLRGVAVVSATDVWAAGFVDTGSGQQTLILHWNGTSWSVVPSPNLGGGGSLLGIMAVSANDVWAVGAYASGSRAQTLIVHWDGISWSVVPSPNVGTGENHLYGIAAVSANDAWAVGYYGGAQALTEHWDGTSWSVVPSPNPGRYNSYLQAVAVVSANDVWAVGYSDNLSDPTLIEHWNGTSWSVVSSPNPNLDYELFGIAVMSANEMWAVGEYGYDSGGGVIHQTLVEHYATLCGTPTNTPTSTSTPTFTPTGTVTPVGLINGHLTWQSISQPNARNTSVTGTLQLCVNGSPQTYNFTTDTRGNFTVTTLLFDGTYHWWVKGGRHLSRSSPTDGAALVISGGLATKEFGVQVGGDATADNIANALDFAQLKNQFGQTGLKSADFTYDLVVNTLDFMITKNTFALAGHALTCP